MKIKNKILRRVLGSFLAWLLDVGLDHLDIFNQRTENGEDTKK